MIATPLDPGRLRRALFVRLRRFGDTVILGPSIRAFRAWAPACRLGVVVQPGYDGFLRLMPEVDDILIAGRGRGALAALDRVRRYRADLTVDFHGGPRAALLTLASRAPVKVGELRFHWPVYDVRVPHAELLFGLDRRSHTIENHLALLAAIGVPTPAERLALPVPDPTLARAEERLAEAGPGVGRRPFALLFPTTTLRGKQWPLDRWISLAARLADRWPGDVLLQFGVGEQALADRARPRIGRARVLDAMSLPELSAVVSRARLVVGQDSLGAHLAAAHGVPSVVLYGGTDPAEYHPWRAEHVVLRVEGLPCSPCGGRTCRPPVYPWACADGIEEETVLATTLERLTTSAPDPGGR